MTDERARSGGERVDLRALDAAADDTRRDALIRMVLNRIEETSRDVADDLARLRRARRRLLAPAALLAGVAAAVVFAVPRRPPVPLPDPILIWAQSTHLPTNGELLAAFQGYTP
jgi:hypothetical protein